MIQFRDPATLEPSDTPEAFLDENVYVECFLLHFRLLLDFFERSSRTVVGGRELDDVLAQDYGFPAAPVIIVAGLRKRINQEIAHLSYARTQRKGDSKNWFPADMARPLLVRCDEFASHLAHSPDRMISPGVREEFATIQRMIAHLLGSDEA